MLVVADQGSVGVRRQGGLSSSGQAEEECDVSVLALVCGRVQGKDVVLDGSLVEHDGEDSLLHLAGVLGSENDHLLLGKVDGHRGAGGHAFGVSVSWEGAGVVDRVVGVEVLQLLARGADEHVAHEERMVGTGANHPHPDSVLLIPSRIAVDDVDAISRVQVVNCSLTVDFPDLTPIHVSATGVQIYDNVVGFLCGRNRNDLSSVIGKVGCRGRFRGASRGVALHG